VNLLKKQLSTVYFKDVRFQWVTLYKGKTLSLSRDKAVGVLTRLRARRLRNFGSILSRDKRVSPIFSPNSRERLWEDSKMCSIANNGSFHRDQSGRSYEAAHSPQSRAEGKNRCISPPPPLQHTPIPRLCPGGGGVHSRTRVGKEKSANS